MTLYNSVRASVYDSICDYVWSPVSSYFFRSVHFSVHNSVNLVHESVKASCYDSVYRSVYLHAANLIKSYET